MNTANTVFVIHGHNQAAKDGMFAFLRALNLRPLEWGQAVSLTGKPLPSSFEVVQAGLGAAQCVVVLLTGDDMTGPIGMPEAEIPQPRPNVLVEMGMALATAGPERTVLVQFENLRAVSDIAGLNSILLSNDPETHCP